MGILKKLLHKDKWKFQWRYFRGHTPWDTNITPPEVMEFIKTAKPGRALDLGCGTGTNAITLARKGWMVTGVDFSSKAIRMAKQKASQAGLKITFYTADVTELDRLEKPFDYILDIGCLFTLNKPQREKYAETVCRLAKPKGRYMLYAWMPRVWKGKTRGISPEAVDELFSDCFQKNKIIVGEEKGHGSAWYWFEKKGR